MTSQKQRILILTRHAKAVEDDPGGDHTRPLAPRGQKDAAELGAWLAAQGLVPEQVFCSTATRTRQTLGLISDAICGQHSVPRQEEEPHASISAGRVAPLARAAAHASGGMGALPPPNALPTLLRDKMYLASPDQLLALIQGADDAVHRLMLVGHNPGMHGLLAGLIADNTPEAEAARVAMKFPTAACAVLRLSAARWADVSPASATLELLRWPAENEA